MPRRRLLDLRLGRLIDPDVLNQKVGACAPGPSIELIDTAQIPNGGLLRLLRCGDDYSIQFGEDELMGSQAAASEESLAWMTVHRMGTRRDRILIGGLGMGFTLGAVNRLGFAGGRGL